MDIMCNLLGAAFLLPLGAALGSFFEVVLDRVPRRESLLWPPSHCRVCQRRLTADELVPVISYLVQRGRCRARVRTSLPASRAYLCDLMERNRDEIPIHAGELEVELAPFKILTLKLTP